ncbi:MAG: GHMP kinase [Candidatus Thermoplasmatota archaeon]
MTLISRAPVRISFGGGGTDLASYYEKYEGMVVSAAISKYIYAILELREDDRIQIISSDLQLNQTVSDFYHLRFGEGLDIPVAVIKRFGVHRGMNIFLASEVPPGTGLGSSGAVCVSMVNLFNELERMKMGEQEIAETAYAIGHDDLGMPIGKQDEYASAFGGVNAIYFSKDGVRVEPMKITEEVRRRLEEDVLLFFTGRTRDSSKILTSQDSSASKGDSAVVEGLHEIKALGMQIKESIEDGDLQRMGELLDRSWARKRHLVKGISNPRIDEIYEVAAAHGAVGGKLTGAGGGGYLMLYCPKKDQHGLRAALSRLELRELDFKFDMEGAEIVTGG